jgi:hypothetical protein
MMLQDAESYVRVQNIYNPENFDRSQFGYVANYNAVPRNQSNQNRTKKETVS